MRKSLFVDFFRKKEENMEYILLMIGFVFFQLKVLIYLLREAVIWQDLKVPSVIIGLTIVARRWERA